MKSVRLYLKTDVKIKNLPGYEARPSGSGADAYTQYFVGKLELFDGQYAYIGIDRPIPPELKGYVIVSFEGAFEWYAEREPGIYEHGSASATVETTYSSGKHSRKQLSIELWSETMEDARELIGLIRTGKIRPTNSFATPQSGPSYRELVDKVTRQKSLIVHKESEILSLREAIMSQKTELDELHGTIAELQAQPSRNNLWTKLSDLWTKMSSRIRGE